MALTVGVFLLLFGAGLWAFTRMGHRFAMVERGVGLVKKKRRIAFSVFFFNDTATTEIYTLSLHDALPICARAERRNHPTPPTRCIDDDYADEHFFLNTRLFADDGFFG